MRLPPNVSIPELKQRESEIITQVRKYELITPLFGGGVEPATADPVTLIRGTSIRGQLRFWWRATRGGQFEGDLQKMKECEDKIWGAASTEKKPRPSSVQIAIDITDRGRPFHSRDGRPLSDLSSPYGYVAFPLRGKSEISKPKEGIKFTFTISFCCKEKETLQKEIDAALWAWETFGGIGARTRRGFGAVRCTEIDNKSVLMPDSKNLLIEISKELSRYGVKEGVWHKSVPHLSAADSHYRLTPESNDVISSWEHLIKKLKMFRQYRPSGRGRSLWPEPDEIRRLTKQKLAKHSKPILSISKFPRAQFGLPIQFEFKDQNKHSPSDPNSDPAKTTLQGVEAYDRLASPLIFRPIACAGHGAVGVVTILETPREPEGGLVLKSEKSKWSVQSQLTKPDAEQIVPLEKQTDILIAFLNFLEEKS